MAIVVASCKVRGVVEELVEVPKEKIDSGICIFCEGSTTPQGGCKILRAATKFEIQLVKSCEKKYGG